MKPDEALRRAALAGRLGRFEVSKHAKERMEQRNVRRGDIADALVTAKHATLEMGTRFRLDGGTDRDGDPLSLVVALEGDCVIVTVF